MGLLRDSAKAVLSATSSIVGNHQQDLGKLQYVAIDVETTGTDRSKSRIVEIGLVHFDALGNRTWGWHSLVNPGIKISNSDIHGIATEDVKTAPKFEDIAELIAESTYGRVVVGHNVGFDLDILRSEYDRIGVVLPPVANICTLKFCHDLDLDFSSHRLAAVAQQLGLPLGEMHSAFHDSVLASSVFLTQLKLIELRGVKEARSWSGPQESIRPWYPQRIKQLEVVEPVFRKGVSIEDMHLFPAASADEHLAHFKRRRFAAARASRKVEACPRCGVGKMVVKSRRDGSGQFLSCSQYPECRYATDL